MIWVQWTKWRIRKISGDFNCLTSLFWTLDFLPLAAWSSTAKNIRKLTGHEKKSDMNLFQTESVQILKRGRFWESSLFSLSCESRASGTSFRSLKKYLKILTPHRSLLGSLQVGKSLDGCCVAVQLEIQQNVKWFLPIATKMMRSASVLRLSLKFSELKVCSSSASPLFNSAASVAARKYSQFQHKSVRLP